MGRAFAIALTLAGVLGERTVAKRFAAALTLATAFSRRAAASRAFTSALSLGTVFARAVITARAFTTALTLAVKGRVDMSLTVLNRITGAAGNTVIVKKILHIFDD